MAWTIRHWVNPEGRGGKVGERLVRDCGERRRVGADWGGVNSDLGTERIGKHGRWVYRGNVGNGEEGFQRERGHEGG